MTREEQIREASIDYQLSTNPRAIGGDAFADMTREMNLNPSFIAGAKWADSSIVEKVMEWLSLNAEFYGGFNGGKLNEMVCKLKKAMEE